jgi:hypothetical protein
VRCLVSIDLIVSDWTRSEAPRVTWAVGRQLAHLATAGVGPRECVDSSVDLARCIRERKNVCVYYQILVRLNIKFYVRLLIEIVLYVWS